MLYVNEYSHSTSPERPTLVFLHGLLGAGDDWSTVLAHLSEFRCLTVDLPCHGRSVSIAPIDFNHTCRLIVNAIREHLHEGEPIVFIGYSLGARLAMVGKANRAYKELNLRGYFLEGGNFGLQDNHEKEQRWNADQRWANRFLSEPIEHVLTDWYQQPVFESLNDKQRDELISNRAHNSGSAIAQMLVATSLAKQPFLLDELVSSESFVHYLCGEQDKKFLRLAEQSKLSFSVINNAGHNAHKEKPAQFALLIKNKLLK